MDTRNPPYSPRYVLAQRPRVDIIGVTVLSPRKTLHPSVDELLDSRARVEAKLENERKEATHSQRKEDLATHGRQHGSFSNTGGASPRSMDHPVLPSTKAMFAASGLSGAPYRHGSLITVTLNDPCWFRLSRKKNDEHHPTVLASPGGDPLHGGNFSSLQTVNGVGNSPRTSCCPVLWTPRAKPSRQLSARCDDSVLRLPPLLASSSKQ